MRVVHLTKRFGTNTVLEDVTMEFPAGCVTCVMGASGRGKTTLLRTLGEELARSGARVILATTTKFLPFPGIGTVPGGEREIMEALGRAPLVCAAAPWGESGKLAASPVPMVRLTALADYVLVEADGSAGLPLKAHAPHEPVIPENSRRVICVVGASGFGKPIRETVHRWERFCGLTGAAETELVTPELAAKALLAEGRCDTMLLNQIDGADRRPAAERFAAELAGHGLRVWGGSLRLGSIFPL